MVKNNYDTTKIINSIEFEKTIKNFSITKEKIIDAKEML